MKATLVAINAKYAHTNPAVRSIAVFARSRGVDNLSFAEFTINQRADDILSALYGENSDVYLFSCYIWNIELVKLLAAELGKIRPDALLFAGGPETSWHSAQFLNGNPAFHGVIRGEGEESATLLLQRLQQGKPLDGCPGLTLRSGDGTIAEHPPCPPMAMDDLPFPYPDLDRLPGKILYYESMRGCPFSCSYCISSIERGVRYRSPALVFADLQRFLDAGVGQVKFVDRTFNCNKDHAMAVWTYLQQHDNGVTNFHFELAGELLDEATMAFLATVRPGLFQFEIGVQSTNPETLEAINRPANLEKLFGNIETLSAPGNIHLHLDLIAGLPYEDFATFARSFDRVYAANPAQFQLGFLKVLKGSSMERSGPSYNLVCRDYAPYEVLCTNWLTYGDLLQLKGVEELLELYYNSGRFHYSIRALAAHYPSPFGLYQALSRYWKQRGFDFAPPDKTGYYQFLGDFWTGQQLPDYSRAKWICKYDMALHEKIKKLPAFVDVDGTAGYRKAISGWYHDPDCMNRYLPHLKELGPKQAAYKTHMEWFPFHPGTGEDAPVLLLFDYTRRDILGHAQVTVLPALPPDDFNEKGAAQ